ncbi:PaaI family thioesterase [Bacillus litorisediminis]|uniref:PaaI family thioesterase n=1 Tax=Bacillus litorisediminis TaxID=2922713 RepID=UPI001FADD6ED|nr:PaaI family thioesterase [Bacillus litorisediminis]
MGKSNVERRFEEALKIEKRDFEEFFLVKFFGFSFSYGEETCLIELETDDYMFNPQGSLHGGVISLLLDVSMGHLCKKFIGTAVTLEMKTQYLRPIYTEKIKCEASFIKRGREIIMVESRVFKENGKLAALATGTWKLLKENIQ